MKMRSPKSFMKLSRPKIALALPLPIAALSLVAAGTSTFMSYRSVHESIIERGRDRLHADAHSARQVLEDWFKSAEVDLVAIAASPGVRSAIERFSNAWAGTGATAPGDLQVAYVRDNPYAAGERQRLDSSGRQPFYDGVNAEYHPYFRRLLEQGGYYDIFLFDPNGNIIYSVFKEADFAANFVSAELAGTDLGAAFRAAISAGAGSTPVFFDFAPYGPSGDIPASFIAVAVAGADGETIGVVAIQMKVGRIEKVMQSIWAATSDSTVYLVGSDLTLRTGVEKVANAEPLVAAADTPVSIAA